MRRAVVFVPLFAVFLFWAATPPPVETYAKVENGKFVIDKDVLDHVRMSPLVGFLMWVAHPFAKWFLHLEAFALVESAKREAGLDQFFDDPYWFPRLAVLCADVNENDNLSVLGRYLIRDNIKRGPKFAHLQLFSPLFLIFPSLSLSLSLSLPPSLLSLSLSLCGYPASVSHQTSHKSLLFSHLQKVWRRN